MEVKVQDQREAALCEVMDRILLVLGAVASVGGK